MNIKLQDLPNVIYACFVLQNFCEENAERISEDVVKNVIQQDREKQPGRKSITNSHSNEVEGKRIRKVLTQYLDP